MIKNILLLIFILKCLFISAQLKSEKWYTADDGLPQNSVKDVVKDKYGFLWISTEKGITRFDGNRFLTSDFKQNTNRFNNFMGSIEKDSILNVNDQENDYVLIKNRKLSHIEISNRPKSKIIYENKEYTIYNKTSIGLNIFPDYRFFIRLDNNTIYFFEQNLIIFFDYKTGRKEKISLDFKMEENMKTIFGHDHILFFRDTKLNQIYRLENGKISKENGDSLYTQPESSVFWSQVNNQTIVICRDTLYISEYKTRKLSLASIIYFKEISAALGSLSINSIFYDGEHHKIFLGSLTKGLYIITLPSFWVSKKKSSFLDNVYYSILPFDSISVIDPEGYIYNRQSEIGRKKLKQNSNKFCFAYDYNKNFLFINNYALYKQTKNSGYQKSSVIPIGERIEAIFSDEEIYVCIQKNKKYFLASYNDDISKMRYLFSVNSPITCIKKYKDQQLIIGCVSGLYLVNLKDKTVKKISNLIIKNIIKTSGGNVWILTKNQGLYYYRNERLIQIPVNKNADLMDPHTILEDNKGQFWISTNNGLFKSNGRKLVEFVNGKNHDILFYRFTKKDGLLTDEFNGNANPTGNVLLNGEFVLPSLDGLVFFNPDHIITHYINPRSFFLERALIDHQTVYFQDTLFLKNNAFNTITLFFDFPYFDDLDNIYLQVLSEETGEWKNIGKSREYVLNTLKPGMHKLKFRFLDKNGNFIYKDITVKVGFIFYQTLFFKFFITFASMFVVAFLIYKNTQVLSTKTVLLRNANAELKTTKERLENTNMLQEKLLETISHDISTPIKHLSHLSRKLNETNNLSLQKKYFDSIYKSSEILYHFTQGLGNYARLFNNSNREESSYLLYEIFEEKKILFENISNTNNTVIINRVSENIFSTVNKAILSTIIHNIIDNAVKNTVNGEILLYSQMEGGSILIRISDNGVGMSEDRMNYYNDLIHRITINDIRLQKEPGYGLKLISILISRINSKIIFRRNPPQGTCVEIILPV